MSLRGRRALPLALLAAACSGGPAGPSYGYKQIRPIPGIIDLAYESPAGWGPTLEPKGEAKDAWEVEMMHPENFFVRMYIRKFSLDPKRKGYPALTPKEHRESFSLPRRAVLTPERVQRTPSLELKRFTVSGDWIEASRGEAPAVRREESYFERDGFLYTVSYTAPTDSFAEYLRHYEHLLQTLRFEDPPAPSP